MTVPIVRDRGSAAAFHQRSFPDPATTQIWTFDVDRPALVLGSTQREDVVDAVACTAAGVEVVRRRSGGGVVLLRPGELLWFDVIVPAEELHRAGVGDDVAASMIWLGEHVAGALSSLGIGDTEVHRGSLACSDWCPLICFAGLGAGEVSRGGVKLVGISQRRTRAGSRFQCAVHTSWAPRELARLLTAHPPVESLPPVAVLDPRVAAQLLDALASALAA